MTQPLTKSGDLKLNANMFNMNRYEFLCSNLCCSAVQIFNIYICTIYVEGNWYLLTMLVRCRSVAKNEKKECDLRVHLLGMCMSM